MAHAAAHIKKARSEMDQPPDLKALEKARERRRRSRERAERKRKVPGRLTGITHLFIPSSFMWPISVSLITSSHFQSSLHLIIIITSSLSTEEVLIRVCYWGVQKRLQSGTHQQRLCMFSSSLFHLHYHLVVFFQGMKECKKDLFMATLVFSWHEKHLMH